MIPNVAHFIWFGSDLPWVYALCIKSAAINGNFEQVVLHHADDISNSSSGILLKSYKNIETKKLSVTAIHVQNVLTMLQ